MDKTEEPSLEEPCHPEDIPLPEEEEPPRKRHRATVLPPFHTIRGGDRGEEVDRVEVVTIEDETRTRSSTGWAERISNVRKILTGIFRIKKWRCADRTRVTSITCQGVRDDQKTHYINIDVVKEAKIHRIIGNEMPPNWQMEIRHYGLQWEA